MKGHSSAFIVFLIYCLGKCLVLVLCYIELLMLSFVHCRYGQLGVGDDKGWYIIKCSHILCLSVNVIVTMLSKITLWICG